MNDCIEYKGILLDGYGIVKLHKSTTTYKAHRLSYQLFKGKIPKGMQICHKCDNRACINPDHLFLGTASDNMRDMVNKGRNRPPDNRGSKHGMSKLTESIVKEIKLLLQQGQSTSEVGNKFNISRQAVADIKFGRTWKHV